MATLRGRIRKIAANLCDVQAGDASYRCTFRKRLKRDRRGSIKLAAVGDEVEFTPGSGGEGEIERLLPRRTKLSRHDVLHPTREQVIVANIDQVLACQSATEPPLEPVQVDRSLIMARAGGADAALAVNKMDLVPREELEPLLEPYRGIGVRIHFLSAATGEGIEELRGLLRGKVTVLLGPSGAGKSSLINALNPSLRLQTGEVSWKTGEGTHTTSWAELVDVGGGLVADTPGIEFFTLWGVDEKSLAGFFPEFERASCRFQDCTHTVEPGCGILEGRGIHPLRRLSYLRILEELRSRPKIYRREGRRHVRRRYLEPREEE
jgi:ribosome biogenesis GTPase